ncbi:MAG: penicillin acylase family protein [Thermoleophilaceae bacterium]|nr:penicillin acylase family protein [Thermoleophilaceae bacterium]
MEQTGRPGLKLVYDEYGIPHVYGKTRADVAFGAGWTTARDRGLLIQLGRGPARVAVADVPGINAFGLVTSAQTFVASPETEALVEAQKDLLVKTYGDKGRQILADAQAYADGVNAYWKANNVNQAPATVNDVIAVTAFIGSIFGAGGGGEATNSELLGKLQQKFGEVRGYKAWDDVMLADDPEAPTTTRRWFSYPLFTGGKPTGSVTIDPGSIQSVDPRQPLSAAATTASAEPEPGVVVDAAAAPPRKQASNFLVVSPDRSATHNSLAVMGPQLGYYYPEIVQQIDLHGPGINAQGAAVPGLAMYILIGRTKDYAWSLTSAGHDVRDVFAEQLCNPDGSAPTRASTHYLFKGQCKAFEEFNAGLLQGTPLRYRISVHGQVIGTATVGGEPYALARKRSTFGRDALNLAALKDMTEGKASSPKRFWRVANQFGFTFNWAYASRKATAYFTSGYLPKRARGLDRRLPTLGTGNYEWQGFLSEREHPHDVSGPGGLLLNWNNRSAPGFMHGDDEAFGSVHRVELFDKFPWRVTLPDDVSVMNRAATEDVRSPVWPVVSKVLHTGPAPNARDQKVVDLLDDWVARDAPRLDADDDGTFDEAGPAIMDAVWRPIATAVMGRVFGDLLPDLNSVRGLGGLAGESYVDKDLRTLLGYRVDGRFNLSYCGEGSLRVCRDSLWISLHVAADGLAAQFGDPDPANWLKTGDRTGFQPGLIPNTMRTTNRPTFQQVLEFQRPRWGWGR